MAIPLFNLQPVSEGRCGWWVDNDPDSLAKALGEFAAMPSAELSQLGRNGRTLVESRYTWPAIAANLLSQYGKLGV